MTEKRYRHVPVNTDDEQNLLIGLIVSDEFCHRVLPTVKPEHLVINQDRRVLQWIRNHYEEYGKAPHREIQSIFTAESRRLEAAGNEAEAELIARFLDTLARVYDRQAKGEQIDWNHRADLSLKYLRQREIEVLVDQLGVLVKRGQVDQAELMVQGFRVPTPGVADLPDLAAVRKQMGDIKWLWPGWIPQGFLTVLSADPGVGKSAIALHLAGVACGAIKRWPDEENPRADFQKQYVLWAEAEGSLAIHAARSPGFGVPDDAIVFFPGDFETFRLDNPQHVAGLEAAVEEYKPALVVVDSFRASHGLQENDSTLGLLLAPLAGIAQRHKIAILLIHHFRKGNGRRNPSLDDLRGSGAIGAVARSVLAADVPNPDYPHRRRLSVVKNNLSEHPAPLGWEWRDGVSGKSLSFDDNPPAAPGGKGTPSAKDEAREALLELLADGQPQSRKWIIGELVGRGISEVQLTRTAADLDGGGKLRRFKKNTGGKTVGFWQLKVNEQFAQGTEFDDQQDEASGE